MDNDSNLMHRVARTSESSLIIQLGLFSTSRCKLDAYVIDGVYLSTPLEMMPDAFSPDNT